MFRKIFLSVIAFGILAAVPAATATAEPAPTRPAYLALGDSLAVGVGASTPEQGYVVRFYNQLRQNSQWSNRDLAGLTVAVSGETSSSMLAPGGQLDRAKAELARNHDADPNNDIEVISVNVGGNDFLKLRAPGQPCAQNTESPECLAAFAAMVSTFSGNYTTIMGTLRAVAGPDTIIVTMTQYNPFSGTGVAFDSATGDDAFAKFNGLIKTVAANPKVNAQVADVFPLFQGKAPQFTHILQQDVHPNDTGYGVITQAFVGALQVGQPTQLPSAGGWPTSDDSDFPAEAWPLIALTVVTALGLIFLVTSRTVR